jgi:hypothetical protein
VHPLIGDAHPRALSAGLNAQHPAVHRDSSACKGVAMYIGIGTIVVILVVLLLIGVLR